MDERFRAELLGGGGAPVQVRPLSGPAAPWAGWWQVSRGDFYIAAQDGHGGEPMLAEVEVQLPAGPCRFAAWLRPTAAGRWQVVARRRLNARRDLRVAVELAGRIGPRGEEPRLPIVVHDLSAAGLGFWSGAPLQPGLRYDVRLDGERGEEIGLLTGQLIDRSAGDGDGRYGLSLEVGHEVQERLYAYLFSVRGQTSAAH